MIQKRSVRRRRIAKVVDSFGGGSDKTNVWEVVSPDIRAAVSARLECEPPEEPLLVSYCSSSAWYVVTTDRLVWLADGAVSALRWDEVTGVDMPGPIIASLVKEARSKLSVSSLDVWDKSGRKYTLEINPGHDYFVVFNAIFALCNRSRPLDPVQL